jgi:hypothetical protein
MQTSLELKQEYHQAQREGMTFDIIKHGEYQEYILYIR